VKEYYCINLKFKDDRISSKILHAHLFVSDLQIYFQIIDNDENSQIDTKFSMSDTGVFGNFEEKFEIIDSEISLLFDQSRIYKMTSFENDSKNTFFTLYISNIVLILPNKYQEFVDEGKAILNYNGLKVVNLFYSYFCNLKDKNEFSISRMQGMFDFYEIIKMSFRPELDYSYNEHRDSEEFTIKKIPTLNYKFNDLDFEQIKRNNEIICSFLSFCYGIRIEVKKLVYRTEKEIFIYRNTEPNNKVFISNFLTIFNLLENNYNIDKILKTHWFEQFILKENKLKKAIDNYLHSREVDFSSSFLLLFNIIEILNVNPQIERFEFNDLKDENFKKAYKLISESLLDEKDIDSLRNKWDGLISKISIKPLKSPLEETLRLNNINPLDFGYSFDKLKKTRDKLTHGSVTSIKEEELKLQIYCLRKISTSLILSNLGLKDDLKKI